MVTLSLNSIGSISSYITYNVLLKTFHNEARDKELFQLKRILRQLHTEYIPILKYFGIVASRFYKKPKTEFAAASREKMRSILSANCKADNND